MVLGIEPRNIDYESTVIPFNYTIRFFFSLKTYQIFLNKLYLKKSEFFWIKTSNFIKKNWTKKFSNKVITGYETNQGLRNPLTKPIV